MSKRFTDTDKFNDVWYRKLPILQKCIWEYLLAECNHAGILDNFDLEMMSFKIGAEVTLSDLNYFKDRITFIDDKTLFIPKFIEFQYGNLNPQSKVHSSVLKELNKYSIDRVSIEYGKGIDTIKDKNKNKYKDINNINSSINNDVTNEKNVINLPTNPNNISNAIVKEFHKQMGNVLNYKIRLNGQQCDKIVDLSLRIPDFVKTIPIVLERMKNLQWHYDDGNVVNADVNWLLDKENYISVYCGKFSNKEELIKNWKPKGWKNER